MKKTINEKEATKDNLQESICGLADGLNEFSVYKVDLTDISEASFKSRHAGCLVLTQDYKILLQQRADDWDSFPGCLSAFGETRTSCIEL